MVQAVFDSSFHRRFPVTHLLFKIPYLCYKSAVFRQFPAPAGYFTVAAFVDVNDTQLKLKRWSLDNSPIMGC